MPLLPYIEVWDLDDGFVVVARLGDVEFRRGYPTREAAYAAQEALTAELATAKTDSAVGYVLVDWSTETGPAESFGKVE